MEAIKIFTGEQDQKKAEEVSKQIIPLLKGMTVNQIEMALTRSLEVARNCMVIS